MPQIDFGRAFSNPDKPDSPVQPKEIAPNPEDFAGRIDYVEPSRFRRSRLGRSEWSNILFTIIAVLGGLFCAFYFFNGAELLKTAASLPREYLYPVAGSTAEADNDLTRLADLLGMTPPRGATSARSGSGNPFSESRTFFAPNSPRSQSPIASSGTGPTTVTSIPSLGTGGGLLGGTGSPLVSLGLPTRGGDELSRALNEGAASLQRLARESVDRVVVVQKTVVRGETRVTKNVKNVVRGVQTTAGKAVANTTQVGRAQQVASSTERALGNTTQQVSNSAHRGVSNLGSGVSRAGSGVSSVGSGVSGPSSGPSGTSGGGLDGLGGLGGLGGDHGGLGGGGHRR